MSSFHKRSLASHDFSYYRWLHLFSLIPWAVGICVAADSHSPSLANRVGKPSGEISLQAFRSYTGKKHVWVLDVRPESLYRAGHVPGALSLPDANFPRGYERLKARLESDKGHPLVVYCSSRWCAGSQWVQTRLLEHGFTHVLRFRGGWEEWQAARLPVEK